MHLDEACSKLIDALLRLSGVDDPLVRSNLLETLPRRHSLQRNHANTRADIDGIVRVLEPAECALLARRGAERCPGTDLGQVLEDVAAAFDAAVAPRAAIVAPATVARRPLFDLEGDGIETVRDALVHAFVTEAALDEFLTLDLGCRLRDVAGGKTVDEFALALLQWARTSANLVRVLVMARLRRPENARLRHVVAHLTKSLRFDASDAFDVMDEPAPPGGTLAALIVSAEDELQNSLAMESVPPHELLLRLPSSVVDDVAGHWAVHRSNGNIADRTFWAQTVMRTSLARVGALEHLAEIVRSLHPWCPASAALERVIRHKSGVDAGRLAILRAAPKEVKCPGSHFLLVAVEPRGEKSYAVKIWALDPDGDQKKLHDDCETSRTMTEVCEVVSSVANRLLDESGIDPRSLFVEVALPQQALCEGVEDWRVRFGRGSYSLASRCVVVVRSWERLFDRSLRSTWGSWLQKWEEYEARPNVHWIDPRADWDVEALFMKLDGSNGAALVAPRGNAPRCWEEDPVAVCIDAGIPVAFWIRQVAAHPAEIADARATLGPEVSEAAVLRSLPEWLRVRRQRQDHRDVRVTLLWDNPRRLPPDIAHSRQNVGKRKSE